MDLEGKVSNRPERELTTEEMRKQLRNPQFLPTHEQIAKSFMDDPKKWREFCEDDPDHQVFEFLNVEYLDALADYFVVRASELGASREKPLTILELGAGNGRLSHFLRQKLKKKATGEIKIIASDSGDWKIKSDFPVEHLRHDEALKEYDPDMVIFSWMPYQKDFTRDIRNMPNVKEYLLIGEANGGACGDEWETWGINSNDETAVPPYAADGFTKENLYDLSELQISRNDTPGEYYRSSSISFRRKD